MKITIDKKEKDIIKGFDKYDLVMFFMTFISALQCAKEVIDDSKKNS